MSEESRVIEGKLVESLRSKELGDMVTECSELGLDNILDDGIVKNIPILRIIVSMAKVGFNIRDRIYTKKIAGFFSQVGRTTQEQRNEFAKKYCDNDIKRFEEAIMLILEQADYIEKTSLIGKVFRACILGELEYKEALKLSNMINKAYWTDLEPLLNGVNVQIDEHNLSLFSAGLFKIDLSGGGYRARYNPANLLYELSFYGKLLVKIAKE